MTDNSPPLAGDRLAKVMARSGLCSRRDAEEWIKAGRVTVNGRKILTPAFNVTATDKVVVDGAPLAARAGTRVWLYHKPKGLVVTEKDPEGRPTVFDTLAEQGLPRVVSVGRLDINTEGLLLVTNDGGLKRVLELPATGWLRKYRVRAHGTVTQAQLDALKAGIEIEGVKYGPVEATLERDQGSNVWLEVALREGKNREVKNILAALGLEVNRLIRVSYGPFQLGDIPVGGIEVVKARVLKDQLGKKLADRAEVDFDSEMPEPRPVESVRRPAVRRPAAPAEREHGRGTHTTTIASQRFRFTDRAELPPEEAAARRAQRPRHDRPGASTPTRRPGPARARFDDAPVRRIHFDDGREPAVFEEKSYGKKPRPGDARPGAGKPPFASRDAGEARRPRGTGAPAGFGDKPRRPRTEGTGTAPVRTRGPRPGDDAAPARPRAPRPAGAPRTFAGKPRVAMADGTPRAHDKPRGAGPGTAGTRGPRTPRPRDGAAPGAGRPARPSGAGRPGSPAHRRSAPPGGDGVRADGGRKAPARATAPRPTRPAGGKPAGTRPPRPAGGKLGGTRPPRPTGGRPGGTRPPRAPRPPAK